EGAIRQIELKGANNLTQRDKELIRYYEHLKLKFSAMPAGSRGWITNKNWVITTPMETGIAPRARAIQALDKIRNENVGAYGPFLSAVERQAMMTISTGVQAVSEGNYGGTEYGIEGKESGWTFVFEGKELPGAKYYVNGRPVSSTSSGIRMSGRRNRLLVVQ